eukprot:scaffold9685_cov90-Amphora_coffeaeformis.AAC.2
MGAWRRKRKGEWPACGCHTLGVRGRRRKENREGRSGPWRDWSGIWQRYGIGYSTNGRRRRSHQRWCSGRSPGKMTSPVVCADGGWRESGGRRRGERREWRSEGDGRRTGTGWRRGPSIARTGLGRRRRAGRTSPGQ